MNASSNTSAITAVLAWEALDSRGNPTVGCEIRLSGGARGTATVPSGASVGTHEAHELRDGGSRYAGKGVATAVSHLRETLAEVLLGMDAKDQESVDDALRHADGSSDLHVLGANALLAASVATALAAADAADLPLYRYLDENGSKPLLPLPMVNIISGGAHAGRTLDIQDMLIVPVGARSFAEAIEMAWRVRRGTADIMRQRGLNADLIADEGGLACPLETNRSAFELLLDGIGLAGLRAGSDVGIAVDVAATQFYDAKRSLYVLAVEGRELSRREMARELASWVADFPIVSVEDGFGDQDWQSWVEFRDSLRGTQVLGDDIFVTNYERVSKGIADKIANAVLVKANQTGTVSAASRVLKTAHSAGWATVVSARSGETEDTWLSDMAIGWRSGQIKVGSTMRSERTAKWNRLLRIEAELGSGAEFAAPTVLAGFHD